MLVLSRKEGEKLVIGDGIVLTINRISGNRVTIGVDAPKDVRIIRGELKPREEHGVSEVTSNGALSAAFASSPTCLAT